MAICYKCNLSTNDLNIMTIGNCLDYVDEWIQIENPKKKPKKRKATQNDFDAF